MSKIKIQGVFLYGRKAIQKHIRFSQCSPEQSLRHRPVLQLFSRFVEGLEL